jgi:hypothetical protein
MRPNASTARVLLAVLPAIPTVLALAGTLVLFSLFLLVQGQPVLDAVGLIVEGAFGSSFAWQSTLLRASPLMLTALCVACQYAVADCYAVDGACRHARGCDMDWRGRRVAAVAWRERNHQQFADGVHRDCAVQVFLSKGRCVIPRASTSPPRFPFLNRCR